VLENKIRAPIRCPLSISDIRVFTGFFLVALRGAPLRIHNPPSFYKVTKAQTDFARGPGPCRPPRHGRCVATRRLSSNAPEEKLSVRLSARGDPPLPASIAPVCREPLPKSHEALG
jgi:hypothetical protein